jgi:uncharacterized damage-inducible protein DinB
MDDPLLLHFMSQWRFARGLTIDLLHSIPNDQLENSPGGNLGPWWKQFRHVGRVQENYLNAMITGIMEFGFEAATYQLGPSKPQLEMYLQCLDSRLNALIQEGRHCKPVNWFGESKPMACHLLCLADHEILHHGQWIAYRRLLGGAFPESWSAWGL